MLGRRKRRKRRKRRRRKRNLIAIASLAPKEILPVIVASMTETIQNKMTPRTKKTMMFR
jgi:hypothetical protein